MTLQKATIANSVQYIAQSERTQSNSRDIKQNTKKNISLQKRQNKKLSQKNKKTR